MFNGKLLLATIDLLWYIVTHWREVRAEYKAGLKKMEAEKQINISKQDLADRWG